MNGCGGGGGGEMSATEAAKKKATPQPNLMKARRTRFVQWQVLRWR